MQFNFAITYYNNLLPWLLFLLLPLFQFLDCVLQILQRHVKSFDLMRKSFSRETRGGGWRVDNLKHMVCVVRCHNIKSFVSSSQCKSWILNILSLPQRVSPIAAPVAARMLPPGTQPPWQPGTATWTWAVPPSPPAWGGLPGRGSVPGGTGWGLSRCQGSSRTS